MGLEGSRGGAGLGRGVPVRRNIQLTRELIQMGVTELFIQDYNLIMQIRRNDEASGTLVFSKYDLKDLVGTEKRLESKLAGYVGRGVPQNFDIKACTAAVTVALWNDLQEQYQQQQRSIEEQKQQEKSILDDISDLRKANPNLTFSEWQTILDRKYRNLEGMIIAKMPEIWLGLEFGLSLLRILNIEDCTLPLIGILLGRPGSGKTVAIMLLSKWIYTCYEDSFSPRSWVTHTTSVNSEEELRNMDLLGMIKDKQFLTPELATVFNLKEDELRLS